MSKRKELRTKAVLPVKVTGVDSSARRFSVMCHTLDLTYDSARLGGLHITLARNQTVFLHRFAVRASFKVQWIGSGARKGQVGLRALETHKPLWGISLPKRQADEFWVKPTIKDRRRFPRHACSGGLEIITAFEYPFWAELTDISATGVYAKIPSPLPQHTLVRIRITVDEFMCEAHAEVMASDPGLGMGLRFTVMSQKSLTELRALLESLRVSFQEARERDGDRGLEEEMSLDDVVING